MTKQQISSSSKLVDARTLAIYELDQFINYLHTIYPDLKIDEATFLAACALRSFPKVFAESPSLVNGFRETATSINPDFSQTIENQFT